MSDESHAFNMSYTTAAIIRLFPVEILTFIFCFVGPSSWTNPYPYLPLCWVCRRWRDIVLNDPKFWSVLHMGKDINWGLNQEVIRRSNSRALDIIMLESERDKIFWSYNIDVLLRLDKFACRDHQIRAKVRSLLFPKDEAIFGLRLKGSSNLVFPQLERLTGSSILDVEYHLVALIASSRLRYVELPWVTLLSLHRQKLLHHLSRVEWLETRPPLTGQPAISVLPEILESLPNLQILILSNKDLEQNFDPDGDISQASRPLIKLPRLRLLSLDLDNGKPWAFHAPNLDYLCVLSLGGESFHDWDLLENINFSEINNILIGIHANIAENYLSAVKTHSTGSVACISGSDRLQLDCLSFKKFHCSGLDSRAAVDDYLDLPPKNSFHLSMPWADFRAFDVVLKRATNLVELTVNYGATKTDSDFSLFLVAILDSVGTRITRLNIFQGRSFVQACALLESGRRAPRLERLMYHNAFTTKVTTFLPGRMEKLQNARLGAGSTPLKILELRNFADIPSWRVQKIEDLGMQLIQTA